MHKNSYGNTFSNDHKKKSIADLTRGIEAMLDDCCAKDLSTS